MSRREAGFTVLELLIALALMAMIGASLASTVGVGARIWERSILYPARDEEILLRLELRRWIERMKPPSRPVGRAQEVAGSEDEFRFLTMSAPYGLPAETETRVTITLTGDATRADLLVRIEAIARDGAVVWSEDRVLARGLVGGKLRYFRRAREDSPAQWLGTWAEPRLRPALVAITAEDGDRIWPPFVAAPKLD